MFNKKDTQFYKKSEIANFSKRYREEVRRFGYNINGLRAYELKGIAKYWNHSCEPNCVDYNDKIISIKKIKPGEELTFDYSRGLPGSPNIRKCNCGAKNCRTVIKIDQKLSKNIPKLRKLAREAAKNISNVKQPLLVEK